MGRGQRPPASRPAGAVSWASHDAGTRVEMISLPGDPPESVYSDTVTSSSAPAAASGRVTRPIVVFPAGMVNG